VEAQDRGGPVFSLDVQSGLRKNFNRVLKNKSQAVLFGRKIIDNSLYNSPTAPSLVLGNMLVVY
jgi:hypothetical protein